MTVVILILCSLLRFVYVTCPLRHYKVVHLLPRKILDPPLLPTMSKTVISYWLLVLIQGVTYRTMEI